MEQNNKWVLTRIPAYPDKLISALFTDRKLQKLSVRKVEEQLVGNIYIGKIQNIAKQINAAFICYDGNKVCHVPLEDLAYAYFPNKKETHSPKPGDNVLIQIYKEALKSKFPGGTGIISLTGEYLVLTSGNTKLGLSNKLSKEEKKQLKNSLSDLVTEEFGFIIRTSAGKADITSIRNEAADLIAQYHALLNKADSRTCYSCLHRATPSYITDIGRGYMDEPAEIITDLPEIYQELQQFYHDKKISSSLYIRIYDDESYPLHKLYGLEKEIEACTKERIWLKSGGYLVIQPTEALTVIDVNTGKFERSKHASKSFLTVNKEAAIESARQIRLRNLSGIILIDFIDMEATKDQEELTSLLQSELRKDFIKTTFVDYTKLGLAELTRKKVEKTLIEQLKE